MGVAKMLDVIMDVAKNLLDLIKDVAKMLDLMTGSYHRIDKAVHEDLLYLLY